MSPSTHGASAPSSDMLPDELRRPGVLRSVFQPVVALQTGEVVAFEALVRGSVAGLRTPAALFRAARAADRLSELDAACRQAAFAGAREAGLVAPLSLLVNVEPEVLDHAPLEEIRSFAEGVPGELRIIVEITERALAARPAELLRTVARMRDLGWGVALDDVGVETASLAFMGVLRPDIVKLDMSLVHEAPSPAVAQTMNAVNAYAEESGAFILAEGIEHERHLERAHALGATLGQGWLYGRPTSHPEVVPPPRALPLPCAGPADDFVAASAFAALPEGTVIRRSPKRLLVELSKQLEREAMRLGATCVVATTFQHQKHFTPATAQRYRDLVEHTGFVCAIGQDLSPEPVAGLRGAALAVDDPLLGEWDLIVLSPHFSVALLARDLGDTGPDPERRFEYALTYRRSTVIRAARGLLSRVAPEASTSSVDVASRPASTQLVQDPMADTATGTVDEALMLRALSVATSGICVVDVTKSDQPLVFVNPAFEGLVGYPSRDLLGRNCRMLQGPDTDSATVDRIRAAITDGREVRETLLNYRGSEQTPWWNELHLSPVRNSTGRVVQYIGVQNDVTGRVTAERALSHESHIARTYLTRIEQLAYTDPLTGLMNRRRFEELIESKLLEAQVRGSGLSLLFMDLNRFKAVNDELGHAAGDQLLAEVARRLRERVRNTDLLARFGGDEFLVAIADLNVARAGQEADLLASQLALEIGRPFVLQGREVKVSVSIGISHCPSDAEDFSGLLHLADLRMFESKHPGVIRPT